MGMIGWLAICLVRRKLSRKGLLAAVGETARISYTVFTVIAGGIMSAFRISGISKPKSRMAEVA
jgi:hypothetical protein